VYIKTVGKEYIS